MSLHLLMPQCIATQKGKKKISAQLPLKGAFSAEVTSKIITKQLVLYFSTGVQS